MRHNLPSPQAARQTDVVLDRDTARLAFPDHAVHRSDAVIASVEDPEVFDPPFVPRLMHAVEVGPPQLPPAIRLPINPTQSRNELQVLIGKLHQRSQVLTIERF